MAVLSITLLTTSPILALSPKNILIGGLVIGIILIFLGALGMLAMSFDRNIPVLLSYSTLMLVTICVSIWGLTMISASLVPSQMEGTLDDLWMHGNNNTVVQIESWGQCCGFHNYSDRVQEPCTLYDQEIGCLEPMREQLSSKLTAMVVPTTLLLVAECIGLAASLITLWMVWREGKEAKVIGERQPFDAWHKAVFQ